MRQLSSFDAVMAYGESYRTPFHVSPFFIYDMSTAPGGHVRFKDILKNFEQRLDDIPMLRQKLHRVPLDLDNPYWIDDTEFELEHHLRHVALPSPGDRRQLSILLSRLQMIPMDLTRPAWDAFVIEGLDNVDGIPKGSFGLMLRIHHAAIDGASGHAILQQLHDKQAIPPAEKPAKTWVAYQAPNTTTLLRKAAMKTAGKGSKFAKLISKIPATVKNVKGVKADFPTETRPVPETRFGGEISPHRVTILMNLDIPSLRKAKAVVEGATINDAMVTIISGAIRRYLSAKGELPTESMTTAMPINIRTEADKDAPGNMVAMSTLNIHSDIENPVERMRAIHASGKYSKAHHNAMGRGLMGDALDALPSSIVSAVAKVAVHAGFTKLPVNTIITNVPGAREPMYMAGAKIVEFHALGILLDGLGLFHAVNSYCDNIAVTVLADRKVMPDPEFYEQCLWDSFNEFKEMAAQEIEKSASTVTKPKSKKVAVKKASIA